VILDVGGGAGVYAFPLAAAGYQVHLVDPVPLHIEQAAAASRTTATPLAGAAVGDARMLEASNDSVDAVLLLGPLYHLTDRADRIKALREAGRVLRPGGTAIVAALSRFYPIFEDLVTGSDPLDELEGFLADGQYDNPTGDPARFTTSYFRRPEELVDEVQESGLGLCTLIGANGSLKLLIPDLAQRLEDPAWCDHLLNMLRLLETEPSIIGMSQNLIAIAQARLPR
jgi:SAM-dependent methyltransferase